MANLVTLSFFSILFVHSLNSAYRWYDKFLWLDIPMHLIGGMWVALLFVYLFERNLLKLQQVHFLKALVLCLGFVALTGIFWEFYEYLADVYVYKVHSLFLVTNPKNYPDTLSDIVNDLLGGSLALSLVYLARKKIQKNKSKTPVNTASG